MSTGPVPMLNSNIGVVLRRFYRRFARDYVSVGSATLPARHLRFGGDEFKDDSYFLASAEAEADRLKEHCNYQPGHRVLDVGCGVGRLPIGILARTTSLVGYTGVDVDQFSIKWCERYLKSGAAFHLMNVLNRRYNPNGLPLSAGFRFGFDEQSFDVIYLYSVFSHMMPDDIAIYLTEFHRLLRSTGTLFLTAFVEDDVPDVAENPPEYRMRWVLPLHCVRYNRKFFADLLARHGFRINRFVYGQETNGQSAFYCRI